MRELGTRLMRVRIDAPNTSTDPFSQDQQTAQVSRVVVTSAEPDAEMTTFGDRAAGARLYRLEFTAVQDVSTVSVWRTVWDHAGETVHVELYPEGTAPGSIASRFDMDAVIAEPDGEILGGDANPSPSARHRFSCSWPLQAKPVLSGMP
jgi:hypothetical protein